MADYKTDLEIAREAENEFINFNNLQSAGGYRYGNLKFHFDDFQKILKWSQNGRLKLTSCRLPALTS